MIWSCYNFVVLYLCFRYLIEKNADIARVNNDGELAIDLADTEEIEELLQQEMDKQGE